MFLVVSNCQMQDSNPWLSFSLYQMVPVQGLGCCRCLTTRNHEHDYKFQIIGCLWWLGVFTFGEKELCQLKFYLSFVLCPRLLSLCVVNPCTTFTTTLGSTNILLFANEAVKLFQFTYSSGYSSGVDLPHEPTGIPVTPCQIDSFHRTGLRQKERKSWRWGSSFWGSGSW